MKLLSLIRQFIGLLLLLWAHGSLAQSTLAPTGRFADVPLETINSATATFRLFDAKFYANQLFLLGESHGVRMPQELDFALLKQLNQRAGVRTYMAEVDCAKAYYLNEYLRTGQEATLWLVFRSWVAGNAQWGNQDFFRKIQRIRALNQTLPAPRRIRFAGLDELQDLPLVADYVAVLTQNGALPAALRSRLDSATAVLRVPGAPNLGAIAQRALQELKAQAPQYRRKLGRHYNDLLHVLVNMTYDLQNPAQREDILFANFQQLYQTQRWAHEKLYGLWGLGHVLQSPLQNGFADLAARIRQSQLPVHDKIASVLCVFSGCQMLYPMAGLPAPWQAVGQPYTVTNKFNHDGPLVVLEGIAELKQRTQPGSATLLRLDAPGAATLRQPIHIQYAPGMPTSQQIQFQSIPAAAYVQYLLLVRDSGPVVPLAPPALGATSRH